jgi:hypothetical protein
MSRRAHSRILSACRIAGIIVLAIVCITYPFLPGAYDSLAMPLSTMAQAGGAVGLLLVPVGILWLFNRRREYACALAAIIVGVGVAAALSLVAFAAVGLSLGFLTLSLWACAAWKLIPRLTSLRNHPLGHSNSAPLYLTSIPTAVILAQAMLAAPLTEWSRNQAIANSREFISDIEEYRARYGRYPTSLLAQWNDYYPGVVGVEKYHYAPHGDTYNLFFEQPRFLFDNIGTREWVVYNPSDEHRMYSHTSWFLLLSPEELERSQGWYAVHDSPTPHWKYFSFD